MGRALYESDFFRWTQETAALIREGRWSEIDPENIAEEIESLGRSERRQLLARLSLLMAHLLKLEFQPEMRERQGRSWLLTIQEQRRQIRDLLSDMPSLKAALDATFADSYESAALQAANETGKLEFDFPRRCPYTLEQVLDAEYLPGEWRDNRKA